MRTAPDQLQIFLIDDNAQMREIVATVLRSFGVRQIANFSDGPSALASLEYNIPDLIFCDLLMEPMDGLEVLKCVRHHESRTIAEIPVIILTGNRDLRSIMSARDNGATEYLIKPISPAVLWQRVVHLLREPRSFVDTKSYRGPMLREPKLTKSLTNSKVALKAGLESARTRLAELSKEYPETLARDVTQLANRCTEVNASRYGTSEVAALYKKAHDIKGQAGTFGFMLVTSIAASMCFLIRLIQDHRDEISQRMMSVSAVLMMHIDAMRICVDQRVVDTGGNDGDELVKTLNAAVRKLQHSLSSDGTEKSPA